MKASDLEVFLRMSIKSGFRLAYVGDSETSEVSSLDFANKLLNWGVIAEHDLDAVTAILTKHAIHLSSTAVIRAFASPVDALRNMPTGVLGDGKSVRR